MVAIARNPKTGSAGLTSRWTELIPHATQQALWNSDARFRVVPSGRRSGKTEFAKRYIVYKAITFCDYPDGWFICAAPTYTQAKNIYWNDLKALVPKWAIVKISETELSIWLFNGVKLQVVGMDKPERVEGPPLDGIILDEYANMKSEAWTNNVRPALSTRGRLGWAWLIGVPEGRNHYYDLAMGAKRGKEDWAYFHWFSADILDPKEVEAAKAEMDILTFQQEYEGSFVTFSGRAYYEFDDEANCEHGLKDLHYDPKRMLDVSFDFNVDPGVAIVSQDTLYRGKNPNCAESVTACMGEVYIPQNSNTPAVCNKIFEDWGDHVGLVRVYGDATGGNRGTAKLQGSDWDLIDEMFRKRYSGRYDNEVPRGNPSVRGRINAVNSRIRSGNGTNRLMIDTDLCPWLIKDLDGVRILKGSAGELDKAFDRSLTHSSDALGYKIVKDFPVDGGDNIEVTLL